jgi:hypothetical protein
VILVLIETARDFFAFIGCAMAWPLAAHAQQPTKLYRIFWISTGSQPTRSWMGFAKDPFEEGFILATRRYDTLLPASSNFRAK